MKDISKILDFIKTIISSIYLHISCFLTFGLFLFLKYYKIYNIFPFFGKYEKIINGVFIIIFTFSFFLLLGTQIIRFFNKKMWENKVLEEYRNLNNDEKHIINTCLEENNLIFFDPKYFNASKTLRYKKMGMEDYSGGRQEFVLNNDVFYLLKNRSKNQEGARK